MVATRNATFSEIKRLDCRTDNRSCDFWKIFGQDFSHDTLAILGHCGDHLCFFDSYDSEDRNERNGKG